MKQDIKNQWVAALRSGEYKQTDGVLCRLGPDGQPIGFCCLGVLTELYVQAHPGAVDTTQTTWAGTGSTARFYAINGGKSNAMLPYAVQEWSGVRSEAGAFCWDGANTSLVDLNDNGSTFEEIADVIDSHWVEL